MRGSNSHGRSQSPLHYHYANPHRVCVLGVCPQRSYIIACPTGFVNAFFEKTSIFSPKFSVFQNSSLLRQSFSVIRCRWISLPAGGTFIPWAIPHNSKCRYGERGAAAAKPKAQIILDVLSSILATQMPYRTPSRSEALRSATAACGGSWRGDPPERCLSRKAGIVRCCLCYRDSVSPYPALLYGFNQIPEALRLLDQFIQNRNIIITALLRHLSDAALIAG